MGLRNKIMIMGVSSLLLFVLITLVYIIPSIKEDSLEKKRFALKDTVEISISLMDALKFESENGRISEDEASNKAIYYTGKFRFGTEKMDTVWLLNSEGVIFSMPYREDLVGKNVANLAESEKKNIYNEMIKLCNDKGEGFVEYKTQYKSEVTKIVPVISFVKIYKPFNLIVGSTIYIEDVRNEIFTLYIKVISATIIILIISIFLLYLASGRIVKPLHKIIDGISNSNLNTVLRTELKDEIGLLVNHFNSFVGNIKGVIIEIKDTSTNLAVSSEELSAISESFAGQTEEQNRFSAEVSRTVLDITNEVEEVASQIDIEFDIMNTLSELINRLDESALVALGTIVNISGSARSGETSLKSMLESFSHIEKRSDDMNEIITMINSISDNINLLSLNAAIEAARAGDAGRGFAVVADEISKLADATSQSINHISSIITDNDRELKDGFTHVQNTVKIIGIILDGFGSIKDWIEDFSSQIKNQIGTKESIQTEVKEIRDMSDTIRKTTRDQKASVMEINKLMEEINKGTDSISSGSEELATGAEEVTAMAEKLKLKVELFKI